MPRCAILLILALARVADARRQDVNLVLEGLEGISMENPSASEASRNQSGDVAESSRAIHCAAIETKAIDATIPISYRLQGNPALNDKQGTYISWLNSLKTAITDGQDNILIFPEGLSLPAETQAAQVKDVGGGVQKKLWDSFAKKIPNKKGKKGKKLTFTQWVKKRKTKFAQSNLTFIKKEMKAILKVDVDDGEFGLLTGGPYAKRQQTAAHFNVLCKCTNFLPLFPSDETKYTMTAAVLAWRNVYEHNFGQTPICKIVVLLPGSTDLHVGIVSDRVEETITMIDYKTTPECYMKAESELEAQEVDCVGIIEHINEIIKQVGLTVLGGSTVFKLDKDYRREHGGLETGRNAFVYLESSVLNSKGKGSKLPIAQVKGLALTGKVYLALRD